MITVDDISKFTLANLLAENLASLTVNYMAGSVFMEREIIPILNRDLEYLQLVISRVDEDEQRVLRNLADEYRRKMYLLMNSIKNIGLYHSDRTNEGINAALMREGFATIEMNSLGMAINANKHGTVLMGATKCEQLDWPLELLKANELGHDDIKRLVDLALVSL